MKSKLSRKFIIAHVAMLLSMALPMLYKHMAISDAITMSVLGIIGASAVGYGVVNVAAKKVDPAD